MLGGAILGFALNTTGQLIGYTELRTNLPGGCHASTDFRIMQVPGEAVPLPSDGFSVRQVNSLVPSRGVRRRSPWRYRCHCRRQSGRVNAFKERWK